MVLILFVVRRLRKFSGLVSLVCVGPRGQPAEDHVGSVLVVLPPPMDMMPPRPARFGTRRPSPTHGSTLTPMRMPRLRR